MMPRTYCNASIPRPGHTGDRLSCSILIAPGATGHTVGDHFHPTGEAGDRFHGRSRSGYAWHDGTAGAIAHDPATAVPVPELDEADVPGDPALRDRVAALVRSAHGRGLEGAPAPTPDEIDRALTGDEED